MKAYSVDLRQKIIDAHDQQHESQRQLAKRFRVSLSFIENLLKRYRTDGTVEPRAHGGGRLSKLSFEQEAVLVTLVEEDNDAIKARVMRSARTTCWSESQSSYDGTYCPKAQADSKKKLCTQLSEKPKGYSSCECSIGRKLER